MQKRVLIVTQLSNYDAKGNWILECDSGWQMCINRARQMLDLIPDLHIDITGPELETDDCVRTGQCVTLPSDVNPDLWEKHGIQGDNRLNYISLRTLPNALATRYDFNWTHVAVELNLGMQKIGRSPKYDIVYVNDPMQLRNLKAMFHIVGGYTPRFVVHSHFIDNPLNPKFHPEASLWHGQCEAAIKADYNFWQCESSMKVFFDEMSVTHSQAMVDLVKGKSSPWDDGYSSQEITTEVDMDNVRFTPEKFDRLTKDKLVIFVPNRIGGRGRSSDYTNCGKFMFDMLPALARLRDDFVVIAGNPSQKFSNDELVEECARHGYINLVPDALSRDEFKYVARRSHIAVGLYDNDSYGGTAARECIELGCLPLWLDNYEYSSIARAAGGYPYLADPKTMNVVHVLNLLMNDILNDDYGDAMRTWHLRLLKEIRQRCAYESTTKQVMHLFGLTVPSNT